mgnify:CR=1 FL=1
MGEFAKHEVYKKVPVEECWNVTGAAPIGTRWVDVNKGDEDNPNLRSRYVGREFNNGRMDCLLAGTPPLEAVRFLIHEAATVRSDEPMGSKVLMINDVSRAFFEAPAKRNICVELPREDLTDSDLRHDKVGHLRMSLYGTRDAASNWTQAYTNVLTGMGFTNGQASPCSFWRSSS